ncbi:hypothetical protein LCGC14_0477190 [marine sediment metagenome]|uniref:Uncharacterized protein n=1 Tax=marine sediment metagenome TaxID=412755 RepID=A0A0F9STF8_9ZZZZ
MPDEIAVAEKNSAQATDQALVSEKESTSKPQTYTEATQKKAISDALAEQGRKHKEALEPIAKERDTFKSQAEQATKDAKDAIDAHEATKGRIADLEADLEQAIGEDADLLDIKKLKTDLRAERDKSRQEARDERGAIAELKKTAEAERLEWAGTVAEAQAFKLDGELARVVDEYEGDVTTNFTKLKAACDKAGIKTKEGAEAIAETFLVKKAEEPDVLNDSGANSGGKDFLSNLPMKERMEELNKRVLAKQKV